MRRVNSILRIVLLVVMTGCVSEGKQTTDDFITVDVTKDYFPQKELILQDFMDVEYVALETRGDFYNQGFVQDIGREIILVINRNRDGNIFVYDRNGKALRKINRMGQGDEEYICISGVTLDEDNNEMLVNDMLKRKIVVYDLNGKFKRSFKQKKSPEASGYTDIFNYDKDNLICYDEYNKEMAFVLISKQDGSITKETKIPFKEKKSLQHDFIDNANNAFAVGPGSCRSMIPFKGNWILSEVSSDTIYTLLRNYSLHPFLVRIPSVQSMDPELVLTLRLLSDRYYFIETIKNIYDFNTRSGFPKTYFVYDKQEKAFFGYAVYNGDFSTKNEIFMSETKPVNHEIESWYPLEAHRLVISYKKGELKGKLKEIAATLDEESNPVIMLIKHKKQA